MPPFLNAVLTALGWLGFCFLILLVGGGLFLWEGLGGAFRFAYPAPAYPNGRIEIYEPEGRDMLLQLVTSRRGKTDYLAEISVDRHSLNFPSFFWTRNGKGILWSVDSSNIQVRYRALYLFESGSLFFDNERSPDTGYENHFDATQQVSAAEFEKVLTQSGGKGTPFFDYKFDPRSHVWRDFLPRCLREED